MSTISSQISSLLTSREVSEATRYLISTRDSLVEAVSGLSDTQWDFKPAPDRWSVAENVEHLAVIEERVHAIAGQMPIAAAAEPDRVNSSIEEIIVAEAPKRSVKAQAPPQACPSRQRSPAETLAPFLAKGADACRQREEELARPSGGALDTAPVLRVFLKSRDRTLELLVQAPSLRGHVLPHPLLGPWDGYQWILAAAAHSARHTDQILEVKACAGFRSAHVAESVRLH